MEGKSNGGYRGVVNGSPEVLKSRGLLAPTIPFTSSVAQTLKAALRSAVTMRSPHVWVGDLRAGYYLCLLRKLQPFKHLLTTRIEGRVFCFESPPQGLSSSTSCAVSTFNQWFEAAFKGCSGFMCSYSDNVIIVDEEDSLQRTIDTFKGRLTEAGISLNDDQERRGPVVTTLGAQIDLRDPLRPQLRPSKDVLTKTIKTLASNDQERIQGYVAHYYDLYSLDLRQSQPQQALFEVRLNDAIYTDGQKAVAAACVLVCGACQQVKTWKRKKTPQSSQANAEQIALLLGSRMAVQQGISTVHTDVSNLVNDQDHASLLKGNSNSIPVLIRKGLKERGITSVKCPGGDLNPADAFARSSDPKDFKRCRCEVEPLPNPVIKKARVL